MDTSSVVFNVDERSTVRRAAHRADHDRETIYSIIDEALYCHVGFVQDGHPYVIPTNHARVEDRILLHGALAGRKMEALASGAPLCITFTLLDGLVLATTAAGHSVNYRSVVVFGAGQLVQDPEEKEAALRAIVEHVMPGRWADAVPPTEKELAATSVVSVQIETASAKVRSGPPGAGGSDQAVWAGVLPIRREFLSPVAAPSVPDDLPLPDYLERYWRAEETTRGSE